MKSKLYFILGIILYMIVTPAFQCGDSPINDCTEYKQDTAMFHFEIPGNNAPVNILDTIKFVSIVSDTIHSVKGKHFFYPMTTLITSLQTYKVVQYNAAPALNYANIEFNSVVKEGEFQNSPYQGYSILHNRLQPYNRMQASLVAGVPGLYLVVVRLSDYSQFIREPNNYCDSYTGIFFIPEAQQQKQYWDQLGTSTLRLAGSNSFIVANKTDRNHFFVKVN